MIEGCMGTARATALFVSLVATAIACGPSVTPAPPVPAPRAPGPG